jgi:hypothetical protein
MFGYIFFLSEFSRARLAAGRGGETLRLFENVLHHNPASEPERQGDFLV